MTVDIFFLYPLFLVFFRFYWGFPFCFSFFVLDWSFSWPKNLNLCFMFCHSLEVYIKYLLYWCSMIFFCYPVPGGGSIFCLHHCGSYWSGRLGASVSKHDFARGIIHADLDFNLVPAPANFGAIFLSWHTCRVVMVEYYYFQLLCRVGPVLFRHCRTSVYQGCQLPLPGCRRGPTQTNCRGQSHTT